jgi:MoaA/NifB/PqqE/SkfB family radical SAM enzyme
MTRNHKKCLRVNVFYITSRKIMIIKDPQALLPAQIQDSWKMLGMVLEVPPHGIPLHRRSVEKLFEAIKSGEKAVALRPFMPIASELSLSPSYPTLAYLYPQELNNNRDIWKQSLQRTGNDSQNTLDALPLFTPISQIDITEQLHYFVDCYGIAVKPSYVRVIVGNTCNLKCVMCPYHSSLLKPTHTTDFFKSNKSMSWEMMERLAKDCGEAKIMIVIGNVEEPMLHPNLVDFVQLCRQQGVPAVHMTTNGQLLDENRAKALLKAGLTSIDISIDAADPDTYLKVRGADLKRVETNVINFLSLRDRLGIPCYVRTSFVRNMDVTPDEEQRFRELWLTKADGVFINNIAQYQETNMRLEKSNQTVQDLLQHYLQKAKGRWTCLFPFIEMAVLPDGRIYYCVETLFRLGFDKDIESLGDYNQQTLQEIWSGELFKQLRRDLILNQLETRPACKSCELWKAQVMSRFSKDRIEVTTTTVTEIYHRLNSKHKS